MKHNHHQLSSHLCQLVLFWSLHSKVWKVHYPPNQRWCSPFTWKTNFIMMIDYHYVCRTTPQATTSIERESHQLWRTSHPKPSRRSGTGQRGRCHVKVTWKHALSKTTKEYSTPQHRWWFIVLVSGTSWRLDQRVPITSWPSIHHSGVSWQYDLS